MISIKARVEKIIYRNEDNGYTIAAVLSEDEDLTVVGTCLELKTSFNYTFKGDFIYHKKYGEQFKFEELEEEKPESLDEIEKYLSSGIIAFVGEKTAKAIVERFKEDSLEIIEKNPDRLIEVEGIGRKKLEKIKSSLEANKGIRDLSLFLTKFGIGNSSIIKIYNEYGDEAIEIIKEDPYKLADDIRGISFAKADSIARQFGNIDPEKRARAALKYTLLTFIYYGNSYLEKNELIKQTKKLIDVDELVLDKEINNLSLDDRFFVERREDGQVLCYFAPYLRAENYISGKLKTMLKVDHKEDQDIDKLIEKIQERQNIKLADKQIQALKDSINNGVLIITGGPGTGKTTTLKAIIELFELLEKSVKLAAPTGRAAKRMKETTLRDASTIHRLLELGFTDDKINYDYEEQDSLDCDVLIVDELSMVDLMLMNSLLKALKDDTRLILVGDKDQLPSIGAGNVLGDLIKSKKIPTVNLTEIFRQSQESMIVKNAHLINKAQMPEITNSKDFFMIAEEDQNKSSDIIIDLVSKRLPSYYNIDSSDIQVLAPMKKGAAGVNNLNKKLQAVLNPKGQEIKYGSEIFRLGDKVMHIKNNYNLEYKIESSEYMEEGEGVFNGDIGYIEKIDESENELYVRYDEVKLVKYEYEDLSELMLAYACTIHKSQGSEFDVVVIPIHFAPALLLTRNLIYTAITRAKKLVVLVGQYKYLQMMVKNNHVNKRNSKLKEKLEND